MIAASNTVIDNVTNQVTHTIFNTNLQYSNTSFTLKVYEKFSLINGF